MPDRITKVTTRTGDGGTTGLADGRRVQKSSLRIECIGDIDELNSVLGLLSSYNLPEPVSQLLLEIQNMLFNIGGELAYPGKDIVVSDDVQFLDQGIESYNRDLAPLKEFILPGGNRTVSVCHLARAVCRRCERHLFALADTEPVNVEVMKYINRLSDLLFVLARYILKIQGDREIYWKKR